MTADPGSEPSVTAPDRRSSDRKVATRTTIEKSKQRRSKRRGGAAADDATATQPGDDAPSSADGADTTGDAPGVASLRTRFQRRRDRASATALKPLAGPSALRFVMSVVLTVMCLVTVGGAILMLLLWQQDREAGVLSTQLDRMWDLFDLLGTVETWLAIGVVPVAVLWLIVATINVRRATGRRRNPVFAAISLPLGLIGVMAVREVVIVDAADWLGEGAGWVLQAVLLAIPLLALQRLTESAEARQRPLHITYLIAVLYLGLVQFLGGLSTIERTDDPGEWGRLGAYLVIGALLQVTGALAVNESTRSIEEGTEQRYQLRSRFGESLLAQAAARH